MFADSGSHDKSTLFLTWCIPAVTLYAAMHSLRLLQTAASADLKQDHRLRGYDRCLINQPPLPVHDRMIDDILHCISTVT